MIIFLVYTEYLKSQTQKGYIIVLEYAEGGNFSNLIKKNLNDMGALSCIIGGHGKIHEKKMVHRDFI